LSNYFDLLLSYLTLNDIVTLKSGLEVDHSRSLKLVPFKSLSKVSIRLL